MYGLDVWCWLVGECVVVEVWVYVNLCEVLLVFDDVVDFDVWFVYDMVVFLVFVFVECIVVMVFVL